jgi:hypothetical protein
MSMTLSLSVSLSLSLIPSVFANEKIQEIYIPLTIITLKKSTKLAYYKILFFGI